MLSRSDVAHLSKIYQSLGMDYDGRVLPSGNEVPKSIVAQFDAAEFITRREVVRTFVFLWIAMHSRALGIIPYKSRSVAACRGIQHQIGGCVYYASW
jgi:prohibitin 1